ncbi:MAG: ABC transporter ATP-binding protein [Mycoplasma sp.]|nr:ABC transporter ATP-binding protein [Mycoplasma sp.]
MKIELRNLSKKYESRVKYTLENINLTINEHDFFVILGPSGCGKSTLLRMIAGLTSITKGDLLFDGIKVNSLDPKDRDIAMVFQSYALYPHMTVYENIAFGLRIRKEFKYVIDEKVREAAKILQIEEILQAKPSDISGGQRQRVALGRAIARKPKLFLMDEPLSNLDAKLREHMRFEIVRLHNLLKTTTVYVTHDQIEAMSMATKIVVMYNKIIQQIGTPRQLYEKPNNLFVANFIGSPTINQFSGKVDGKHFISNDGLVKILLTNEKLSFIKENNITKIILAIRSEDIQIVEKNKPYHTFGKLALIELLGKEQQLTTFIGKNNKMIISLSSSVDLEHLKNQMDKIDLYFKFNEKRIHLFDQETQNRI